MISARGMCAATVLGGKVSTSKALNSTLEAPHSTWKAPNSTLKADTFTFEANISTFEAQSGLARPARGKVAKGARHDLRARHVRRACPRRKGHYYHYYQVIIHNYHY